MLEKRKAVGQNLAVLGTGAIQKLKTLPAKWDFLLPQNFLHCSQVPPSTIINNTHKPGNHLIRNRPNYSSAAAAQPHRPLPGPPAPQPPLTAWPSSLLLSHRPLPGPPAPQPQATARPTRSSAATDCPALLPAPQPLPLPNRPAATPSLTSCYLAPSLATTHRPTSTNRSYHQSLGTTTALPPTSATAAHPRCHCPPPPLPLPPHLAAIAGCPAPLRPTTACLLHFQLTDRRQPLASCQPLRASAPLLSHRPLPGPPAPQPQATARPTRSSAATDCPALLPAPQPLPLPNRPAATPSLTSCYLAPSLATTHRPTSTDRSYHPVPRHHYRLASDLSHCCPPPLPLPAPPAAATPSPCCHCWLPSSPAPNHCLPAPLPADRPPPAPCFLPASACFHCRAHSSNLLSAHPSTPASCPAASCPAIPARCLPAPPL
ncbi:hypothetical protein PCASD_24700 [Puccinia coronata f. sp. avenae]|uniref:Uncharacterized protein n=1 Tax=Puccinia coronata f. sp. avenae TaxID=200324 RepID=A0A2N5TIK2_9BASI|nr:hypothetical protein PCASD_24700 [Puccinia coronata f. sp. avenae]